ncbi:MAG: hypothetical protein RL291_1655 [Pseudomonadota bacterium]|jgi:beta-phosphoglucomutase-like phosphatase (HAD superfamily)
MKRLTAPPDLIIFDFDGVIADSVCVSFACIERLIAA